MIFTLALNLLYNIVYWIITPLFSVGDVSLSGYIPSSITTASNYLANINGFFPLSTLFAIVGIYIVIELSVATYKGIMWLIKKIPTIN